MNRQEAIKILSDYEENGCGFCHQGGDEVPQAFDMAVKALEAWEKVIEEIEQLRAKFKESGGVYEHSAYGLDYATEIIKKHLGEVEDEQTER